MLALLVIGILQLLARGSWSAELRIGLLTPQSSLSNASFEDVTLANSSTLIVTARTIELNLDYELRLREWQPQLVLNLATCQMMTSTALPNVTELLAPASAGCDAVAAALTVESGQQEEALAETVARLAWRRLALIVDDDPLLGSQLRLLAALGRRGPDAAVIFVAFNGLTVKLSELENASVRVEGFLLALNSAEKLGLAVTQLCGRNLLLWSPPAVPQGDCRFCYFSPWLPDSPLMSHQGSLSGLSAQLSLRQADLLNGLASLASSAVATGRSPVDEIRTALTVKSRQERLLCRVASASSLGLVQSGEFAESTGRLRLDSARFPASSGYLENRHLLIELKMVAPFSFPGTRDQNGLEWNVTGLSIDMLNEVASRLKFSYRLRQPPDGNWGAPYPNGTWSGMVGDVLRKEADFAIGPFTMTAIRESVIDFSVPFMQDGNAILIKKPAQENPMFRVLSPFSLYSWLAILGSMLLSSFCIFLCSRLSPFSAWNLNLPDRIADEVSFKENIWSAIGTLLQQGQDFFPVAASARIVLGLWWCTVVVIMALYTADMIGYLTLNLPATSVENLEQLASQSVIEPIVKSGANAYTLFEKSPPGSTYNNIYKLMGNMPKFTENEEGIRLVKGLDFADRQFAFIGDRTQLSYAALTNCDLLLLSDVFNVATFGWPMSADAPYKDDINRELQRLVDSGMMARWIKKWWSAENICAKESDLSDAKPVDLLQAGGTFIILAGFFGSATVVLLIECLLHRIVLYCQKYKNGISGRRAGWQGYKVNESE